MKEYMSEQEWLDIFGDNLKDMMNEWGDTQESLSSETGLTQGTISNYINKKQIPSLNAIVKLSYAFDCTIDELIDFGYKII